MVFPTEVLWRERIIPTPDILNNIKYPTPAPGPKRESTVIYLLLSSSQVNPLKHSIIISIQWGTERKQHQPFIKTVFICYQTFMSETSLDHVNNQCKGILLEISLISLKSLQKKCNKWQVLRFDWRRNSVKSFLSVAPGQFLDIEPFWIEKLNLPPIYLYYHQTKEI